MRLWRLPSISIIVACAFSAGYLFRDRQKPVDVSQTVPAGRSDVAAELTASEGKTSGLAELLPAPRVAVEVETDQSPITLVPLPAAPPITISTLTKAAHVGVEIPLVFEIANQNERPLTNLVLQVRLFGGLCHPAGNAIEAAVNAVGPGRTQSIKLRVRPSRQGEAWLQLSAKTDDTEYAMKEFRLAVADGFVEQLPMPSEERSFEIRAPESNRPTLTFPSGHDDPEQMNVLRKKYEAIP
jgi:hypothetical protein